MSYEFKFEDRLSTIHPIFRHRRVDLVIDGVVVSATLEPGDEPNHQVVVVDGHREPVWIASSIDSVFLHFRGRSFQVDAVNTLERVREEMESTGGADNIVAPMPGTLIDVLVSPDQAVKKGQALLTIESMKLQTSMKAPNDSTIREVRFKAGQTFERGAVLVVLESQSDGEPRE